MREYYFYNPETGCGWQEEMTSTKKERFLENRPWIKEGNAARESHEKQEQKRQEWANRYEEDQEK